MDVRKLQNVKVPNASPDAGRSLTLAMDLFNASPKDMCEFMDITRQHLHTMKGQKTINDARLEQIAEYFHLTVQEFLSLPQRPLSVAFSSTMREMTKMLREQFPIHGRFVLEVESHVDQIKDKLIMLENS